MKKKKFFQIKLNKKELSGLILLSAAIYLCIIGIVIFALLKSLPASAYIMGDIDWQKPSEVYSIETVSKAEGNYSVNASYPVFHNSDITAVCKQFIEARISEFSSGIIDEHMPDQGADKKFDATYAALFANNRFVNIVYYLKSEYGIDNIKNETQTLLFDLEKEKLIKLSDLFKNDSNYLNYLSEKCRERLLAHPNLGSLAKNEKFLSSTRAKAECFSNFILYKDKLTVLFDSFDIAPVYSGVYCVDFPLSEIAGLLTNDIIKILYRAD